MILLISLLTGGGVLVYNASERRRLTISEPPSASESCKTRNFGQDSNCSSFQPIYQEMDTENTGIAKNESNGWIDTPDNEWALIKELHYINRCDQFGVRTSNVGEYANFNWRPTISCPLPPVRIGHHDGGKMVCPLNLNNEDCLVYSVGSAGNFKFENELLKWNPGCEIHTFDPDPKYANTVSDNPNIIYHAIGFAGEDNGKFQKLFTVMKNLGHEGRKIDIFKIDCEGCEWEIISEFTDPNIELSQILVEAHGIMYHEDWLEALLNHGYVMFSKELNSFGCGEGRCIEFSFLKFNEIAFN